MDKPQRKRLGGGHVAATGILTVMALSLPPSALPAADAPGARLYESKGCYQCHGYVGQGGAAGPRLAPDPIPMEAFKAFVRKPPNVMPAYSPKVLSDEELTAIYGFVASLD